MDDARRRSQIQAAAASVCGVARTTAEFRNSPGDAVQTLKVFLFLMFIWVGYYLYALNDHTVLWRRPSTHVLAFETEPKKATRQKFTLWFSFILQFLFDTEAHFVHKLVSCSVTETSSNTPPAISPHFLLHWSVALMSRHIGTWKQATALYWSSSSAVWDQLWSFPVWHFLDLPVRYQTRFSNSPNNINLRYQLPTSNWASDFLVGLCRLANHPDYFVPFHIVNLCLFVLMNTNKHKFDC